VCRVRESERQAAGGPIKRRVKKGALKKTRGTVSTAAPVKPVRDESRRDSQGTRHRQAAVSSRQVCASTQKKGGKKRSCTSQETSKGGALKVLLIDRRRPVRAEFVSARVVVLLLVELPGMPPRELAYL
jgi:hypothetical protein